MTSRRLDYVRRTGADAYERALRALRLTITLDTLARAGARGDAHMPMSARDAAIADTVDWILRREDRILLAAHNGHIQRWPATAAPDTPPFAPMGLHLADRLDRDYLAIGMTTGTGLALNTGPDFLTGTLFTEQEPSQPGSLDALMAATHAGPFAVDLRQLSPADTATIRTVSRQRSGTFYTDLSPLDAYDLVIHLPHVTAAEPDTAAIGCSPLDVQEAFSHWEPPAG